MRILLFFLLLATVAGCSFAQTPLDHFPRGSWQAHPASAWSQAGLDSMRVFAEAEGSASYMVVEDGYVIDSFGRLDEKVIVQSVRKSVLSALYGKYVQDGTISLDASMDDLWITDHEPLSKQEKGATVRDLLQARSGVYIPSAASTPSMLANLPERDAHEPGSYWYYNNWDFNVLGTIFNQVTGLDLFEALEQDLAQRIGMEDFEATDGRYFHEPMSQHPAHHMWMTTRDMARLGVLMAREGVWNGEQIVPQDWVKESTRSYSEVQGGGYGYMWWTDIPGVPRDLHSYAARGGRGHMILVVPDLDLVFVHRVPMESENPPDWGEVVRLIDLMFNARGRIR